MSKPEKTFKAGAVRASIFRNTAVRNGKQLLFPKTVIEVRYKDKNGQWKGTNSLSLADLPKAIVALQRAYEYLLENRDGPGSADEPEEEVPLR